MALSLAMTGCGGGSDASDTTTAGGDSPAVSETAANGETGSAGDTNIDTAGFFLSVLNADIQTVDVQKTSKDYAVPMNVFDRLVEIEVDNQGNSKIVPSLAEDWDISSDGLEYTFHLRQDVKFQNGNDFTAEDVLYTFKRLLTVEGSMNTELLDQVKGAAEMIDGSAAELEGVEVIDEHTVKITLTEPFAAFLSCLTAPGLSIFDSEATEAAGDQFGMDPSVTFGTGPFCFASWSFNNQLVLVRNEDYWKAPPRFRAW